MKSLLVQSIRFARLPAGRSFACNPSAPRYGSQRFFGVSARYCAVQPYILADIGEGITECQIIEWHVQPGDRVEQFDKICEVQSDKASVEITSRFDGIVKSLHYETDDMAIVGKPLIDIDIDGNSAGSEEVLAEPLRHEEQVEEAAEVAAEEIRQTPGPANDNVMKTDVSEGIKQIPELQPQFSNSFSSYGSQKPTTPENAALMTPAVRHLLKELNFDVADVLGTGKGGRVTKEDVQRYSSAAQNQSVPIETSSLKVKNSGTEDKITPLTPTLNQMFKVMTRSLTIPHFLYTHTVDFTPLDGLRKKINSSPLVLASSSTNAAPKLTPLPFFMKALSNTFLQMPILNSHLDIETNSSKPQLVMKGSHHFGIAVDTSQGLLVPVVRDVQNHSVVSLAIEISRLSKLAKDGKLQVADFQGATFMISNIGSIGGSAVSPIIVAPMVGILGIGRAREVPAFGKDEIGNEMVVKKQEVVLSWSADHRVLDGATVARCAELLRTSLENFEVWGVTMK